MLPSRQISAAPPSRTRPAGSPTRLATGVLLGAAAIFLSAVTSSAPAAADTADYLRDLQPKYVYLSTQQLLDLGHRACAIAQSGQPASAAVDTLDREAGLGAPVAFDIVRTAIVQLDC